MDATDLVEKASKSTELGIRHAQVKPYLVDAFAEDDGMLDGVA